MPVRRKQLLLAEPAELLVEEREVVRVALLRPEVGRERRAGDRRVAVRLWLEAPGVGREILDEAGVRGAEPLQGDERHR
jgi:hypothetical protein